MSIKSILENNITQMELYKENGNAEQFGKKAPKTQENNHKIGKVELNNKHDS